MEAQQYASPWWKMSIHERNSRYVMKPLAVRLRAEIHPVWSLENFTDPDLFAALLHSIRLATKLMQTPAVEHFCHSMLFGKVDQIDHKDTRNRKCRRRHRLRCTHTGVDDLDEAARELVRIQLTLVASQIRHRSEPMAEGCLAYTDLMTVDLQEHMPRGSIIAYNTRMLDDMLTENLSQDERRVEVVHKAFVLLHEFAHALFNWRFGQETDYEHFFEGSTVAESGFELEARLIGGVPAVRTNRHGRRYLVVDEWPSQPVMGSYDLPAFCERPAEIPVQKKAQEWKVHIMFIRALVDDEYWEDDEEARNAIALIPESLANTIRACLKIRGKIPPVPETVAALFG